jgi:hypothetical protein
VPERPADSRYPEDDTSANDDLLALLAPAQPSARPPVAQSPPDHARRRPPPVFPPAEPAVAETASPGGPPAAASGSAPVAVGRRFHPVPGAPPLVGSDAVLVAGPDTPVHAVSSGAVLVEGGGVVRLKTDAGMEISYTGLFPESITIRSGARVAAGAILGVVAVGPERLGKLALRAHDAAGAELDAAALLVGLPDPNELGYAAIGGGLGIDPDALDRVLGQPAADAIAERAP